ncbi:YheC/YheD family protein [Paenibacillus aurantiacus]|uniref:YheC/YheD family protein n=1 Tax=Paenibacillus aurantiacus TaxID=1936118 RepID=A0ABV5KHG1_9BACL
MSRIPPKRSSSARSKWAKHQILIGRKELAQHLPSTQRFAMRRLWRFIEKFEIAIIKPTIGHSGYGILQVSQLEKRRYAIQTEDRIIIVDGKRTASDRIARMTRNRSCLVQQWIPLARIDDRPFDLRVIVSRPHRKSAWAVTGMYAKLAEADYMITNVAREIMPATHAIEYANLRPTPTRKLIRKIKAVCLTAAKRLASYYPDQRIIGFDIGVDVNAEVWLIEANFKPSLRPLWRLK